MCGTGSSPELPSVFSGGKQTLALAHKQLLETPVVMLIGLLFQLLPTVVWLKGSTTGRTRCTPTTPCTFHAVHC